MIVVFFLGAPPDFSDIGWIPQYVSDRAVLPGVASLCGDLQAVQLFRDGNGPGTGQEVPVDHADDLRFLGEYLQRLAGAVTVAQGRDADRQAAADPFRHAAPYLHGQIGAVKGIEPFDDTLDQPAEGTFDHRLGNADDVDVVFLLQQ